MCTLILLRRPGHPWPLLLAANRDERLDRPWDAPGRHWPGRPDVIGGRDRTAGGTWMALRGGVVAAVLNRPGSLGPVAGKLSRGDLPLMMTGHPTAADAARAAARLDAGLWRPFNAVVADARDAFFVRGTGAGRAEVIPLGEGASVVTAHDPNSPESPRTQRHLPRFQAAAAPDPGRGDWRGWEALLADDGGGAAALTVPPVDGFGTVCASLLALGATGGRVWRFAPGPAGTTPFHDVLHEVPPA